MDRESFEGFEMFYDGLGSLGFLKRELGVRVEPFVWIAVNASMTELKEYLQSSSYEARSGWFAFTMSLIEGMMSAYPISRDFREGKIQLL